MNQLIEHWISDQIDDDMRQEWIDALRSLVREEGKQSAQLLLEALTMKLECSELITPKPLTLPTGIQSHSRTSQHIPGTSNSRNN